MLRGASIERREMNTEKLLELDPQTPLPLWERTGEGELII